MCKFFRLEELDIAVHRDLPNSFNLLHNIPQYRYSLFKYSFLDKNVKGFQ